MKSLPKYKCLIRNLVSRDLTLKYRASIMGYLWSMLNPLMLIITYIIAFKYILGMRSISRSQIIVGVVLWTFCATAMMSSVKAILTSAPLLQKVTFPRVIPVISTQIFCLIQHLIVYPVLFITLLVLKKFPNFNWLYVFLILILLNIMLFGMGLFLSTVNIFYRDVEHFLAIAIRILFWFTPIVYNISILSERRFLKYIIAYTPFSPFVRSMTAVLCDGHPIPVECGIQMVSYSVAALGVGIVCFYSFQHRFVEAI